MHVQYSYTTVLSINFSQAAAKNLYSETSHQWAESAILAILPQKPIKTV